MERFTVSALCTREEYIAYCAARKNRLWPTALGIALLLGGAAGGILRALPWNTVLLFVLLGGCLALVDPLFLPIFRKGEAARRYDESDSLNMAVTLTFEGETVTVRGARVDAELPLSLATVSEAGKVLSLRFGAELNVLVPLRAFSGEQIAALRAELERREPIPKE